MRVERDVFFLGKRLERRFVLVNRPAGAPIGVLIHCHAFAEELNRSRHMVALAAHAFAEAGWLVVQVDHHGCGDSADDFGAATWASWQHDLDVALQWARTQTDAPLALWTLRAGSLMASSWLRSRQTTAGVLAWQPVLSGKQYLTQFLRIRLGADLAQSKQAQQVLTALRDSLARGEPTWVAGYELSAQLASDLEGVEFDPPDTCATQLLELAIADGELTPASQRWMAQAQARGLPARGHSVGGPKFWQTQEIETAPALIAPSLAALGGLLA